jgi:hypothetical protein
LIEEIHGDNDAQMQSSFQVYDGCSGIRELFILIVNGDHSYHHLLKSGGPDECQVAADTYQCGRDLAPKVTADIFTLSKGNATVVS